MTDAEPLFRPWTRQTRYPFACLSDKGVLDWKDNRPSPRELIAVAWIQCQNAGGQCWGSALGNGNSEVLRVYGVATLSNCCLDCKNGNVLMVSLCVSDDEQCHAGMSCCDDRVTSHFAMSCVCLKYLSHRPMCWFPLASLYKWIRLLKYPNVYSHTLCSFSVSIISKYWQDVRLFSFWF